jgi:hypothetical protein
MKIEQPRRVIEPNKKLQNSMEPITGVQGRRYWMTPDLVGYAYPGLS